MLDSADAVARTRLRPGEHLLWSGRPDPKRLFTRSDAFLIPFGVFFLGFSIFWTVTASRTASSPAWLFGTVFIAVGVYYLFGRFVVKRRRQLRSTYAVTDDRALAIIGDKLIETPISAPRTTTWSGTSHVTVMWATQGGAFSLSRGQIPVNSGLDGIFGPMPMAFFDVPDPEGLIAALDRTGSRTDA